MASPRPGGEAAGPTSPLLRNPGRPTDSATLTTLLTGFTLVAFAANSVLCRMALGRELVDPVSFTTLRLISGAVVLAIVSAVGTIRTTRIDVPGGRISDPRAALRKSGSPSRTTPAASPSSPWFSAVALFAYAIAFSLAYVSLDAGVGALLLFGAVQVTMIGAGMRSGERPDRAEWLGLAAAVVGLVYLTRPGSTAPDLLGSVLMLGSGVAWGLYSLRGKGVTRPVQATASSFVRTAPMTAVASIVALPYLDVGVEGALLAVTSGAVTSGLGYVLWYRALRGLTMTRAAIVQLLVPVLAAFGGVAVLNETVTGRLVLASILILGGVAGAILGRRRSSRTNPAVSRPVS